MKTRITSAGSTIGAVVHPADLNRAPSSLAGPTNHPTLVERWEFALKSERESYTRMG